ncbi:MAG: hypothetical protein B7Y39_10895 [Bdellovibrio sp. 28-41-41]|nr:MAG: hypothetical protein B7Y39_10895 [Bdellovibrio sp. 28-41-41]
MRRESSDKRSNSLLKNSDLLNTALKNLETFSLKKSRQPRAAVMIFDRLRLTEKEKRQDF